MRLFFLALMFTALVSASSIASASDAGCVVAGTCPKVPPGFTWYESTNDVGSFMRPDGWFAKEETKGDTRALFITREDINITNTFVTGLTVNKMSNFSQTNKVLPSQFARSMIARLRHTGEVLREAVIPQNNLEMQIVRVKQKFEDGIIIVHYIAIGDDTKGIFYLIAFESSEADWPEQYKFGAPMLNFFGF